MGVEGIRYMRNIPDGTVGFGLLVDMMWSEEEERELRMPWTFPTIPSGAF